MQMNQPWSTPCEREAGGTQNKSDSPLSTAYLVAVLGMKLVLDQKALWVLCPKKGLAL
jgi:hypothetical protein